MKNKNIELVKNLLLGKTCFECKYFKNEDVWRLADGKIKCKKRKKIFSENYVCIKWAQASLNDISERLYYKNRYERNKEFHKNLQIAQQILDKWGKEKNLEK